MNEHSPAPWQVTEIKGTHGKRAFLFLEDANEKTITEIDCSISDENLRLIAVAPEILAILCRHVVFIEASDKFISIGENNSSREELNKLIIERNQIYIDASNIINKTKGKL